MKLLVKDIKITTLQSGDKEGTIILKTTEPKQAVELALLSIYTELEVEFKK